MNEIFQQLIEFTENEGRRPKKPFDRNTRLYEDLGITGDDAVEFLIAYGKHFQVDVSRFMAADYFEGEGMNLLIGNGTNKKGLTLGDLEKGIIAGKLDEDVIHSGH